MYGDQFLLLTQAAAVKSSARHSIQSILGRKFMMAEGEVKENMFSFDELVSIFSYLSPENLSQCSQVCRDWHEASQVGSLWKRHCLQRWNFCHLGKLKPGRWMGKNVLFANLGEKCHSTLFLSQRISKSTLHHWILSLAGINILRVWYFILYFGDGHLSNWSKLTSTNKTCNLVRISVVSLIS